MLRLPLKSVLWVWKKNLQTKEKIVAFWGRPCCKLPSVMTSLFDWQLGLVLEMIFLFLDGASMHASRQVCRRWNEFILCNMWHRKVMRQKLENKLHWKWKYSPGSQSTINLNPGDRRIGFHLNPNHLHINNSTGAWSDTGWIWSVDCDDSIFFFGFTNGTASVVDRTSVQHKQTFQLNHSALNLRVKVKVGRNVLVTLCDGNLCVFQKDNFALVGEFESSMMPREKERPLHVLNNTIVARGNELFQCLVVKIRMDLELSITSIHQGICKTLDATGSIKCLAYDGNFIAMLICTAENHSNMAVHNVTQDTKSVMQVSHRTNHIHGLTLRYPKVIIAIGAFLGEKFGSFEIMDINSGNIIRRVTPHIGLLDHIDHYDQHSLRNIHVQLNKRFLFFCSHSHRIGEWVKCQCVMFDIEQLMEKEVKNEQLWMRRMEYQGHMSYVDDVIFLGATQNTAKLFNFWL